MYQQPNHQQDNLPNFDFFVLLQLYHHLDYYYAHDFHHHLMLVYLLQEKHHPILYVMVVVIVLFVVEIFVHYFDVNLFDRLNYLDHNNLKKEKQSFFPLNLQKRKQQMIGENGFSFILTFHICIKRYIIHKSICIMLKSSFK